MFSVPPHQSFLFPIIFMFYFLIPFRSYLTPSFVPHGFCSGILNSKLNPVHYFFNSFEPWNLDQFEITKKSSDFTKQTLQPLKMIFTKYISEYSTDYSSGSTQTGSYGKTTELFVISNSLTNVGNDHTYLTKMPSFHSNPLELSLRHRASFSLILAFLRYVQNFNVASKRLGTGSWFLSKLLETGNWILSKAIGDWQLDFIQAIADWQLDSIQAIGAWQLNSKYA